MILKKIKNEYPNIYAAPAVKGLRAKIHAAAIIIQTLLLHCNSSLGIQHDTNN